MITQKQVEVLKEAERHVRDTATSLQHEPAGAWYAANADALAAAIATIEGLEKTRDKCHAAPGDEVEYRGGDYTMRGMCDGSGTVLLHRVKADGSLASKAIRGSVAHCYPAAAARGEVEGG